VAGRAASVARYVGQDDSKGRCGVSGPKGWSKWIRVGPGAAEDLPGVVVSAYEMPRGERPGTGVGPDVA
jgi:hypothetical protein